MKTTITVKGLKMNYTGKQIGHQSELPKSAKNFSYDYTEDLKQELSIYYTSGKNINFFILIK